MQIQRERERERGRERAQSLFRGLCGAFVIGVEGHNPMVITHGNLRINKLSCLQVCLSSPRHHLYKKSETLLGIELFDVTVKLSLVRQGVHL